MLSAMERALLMGMAKPMLSMDAPEELLEYLALVMPMTSPYRLNSAPPELPELMAQSVCISCIVAPLDIVISRSLALIEPEVREKVNSPKGLPMATTLSPTFKLSELPKTTGVKLSASIFRTATSLLSS